MPGYGLRENPSITRVEAVHCLLSLCEVLGALHVLPPSVLIGLPHFTGERE